MALISRRDKIIIETGGGNVGVRRRLEGRYLKKDNTSGMRKITTKAGIFSFALIFSNGLIMKYVIRINEMVASGNQKSIYRMTEPGCKQKIPSKLAIKITHCFPL